MKSRALFGWALLALVAAPALASPASDQLRASVRNWREANERKLIADYSAFVAMPSIASNLADVDRNADFLEAQLKSRGFTTSQLRARPGTPASVFAERRTPGAKRTLLLYAHYDGQPVNQPGWLDPPFQPTLRTAPPASAKVDLAGATAIDMEWRLHGRATGDDKSTIAVTLWALDALAAKGIKPNVNIKILWEGEEEAGSPNFGTIVRANKALLAAIDDNGRKDGIIHGLDERIANQGRTIGEKDERIAGICNYVQVLQGEVASEARKASQAAITVRHHEATILRLQGEKDSLVEINAELAKLAKLKPAPEQAGICTTCSRREY
jgi:acetylornithine deacetylase/succinyl-diaminopimelate desuccinylase-like protein